MLCGEWTRVRLDLADLIPLRVYELNLDGLTADDGSLPLNTLVCDTLNCLPRRGRSDAAGIRSPWNRQCGATWPSRLRLRLGYGDRPVARDLGFEVA